jgi:hypothetical protein
MQGKTLHTKKYLEEIETVLFLEVSSFNLNHYKISFNSVDHSVHKNDTL